MPQNNKKRAKRNSVTRKKIITAAFAELRENGWEEWNARKIAKRAGCSTMPLFRLFKNMEEIREEVISAALRVYEKYISAGLSETLPYRGAGRAYIRFAKEEPRLFNALCSTKEFTGRNFSSIDPTVSAVLSAAEQAGETEEKQTLRLHACMTLFCHGAAMMASCGAATVPEEYFDELTSDVFHALKAYYNLPANPPKSADAATNQGGN